MGFANSSNEAQPNSARLTSTSQTIHMKIGSNQRRTLAIALLTTASALSLATAATLSVGDIVSDSGGTQWRYVGAWKVADGPSWTDNPQVYSGQEAAALLFGGNPGDYAISISETLVTHTAYMSAYGIADGWEQPESYSFDQDEDGYLQPGGAGSAYSAYVSDNAFNHENLAFRAVPEPSSTLLLGVSLLAGAAVRRRKA